MAAHSQDFLAWSREKAAKPPVLLKFRSSSTFILSTICIAVFTDIFLYSVIVPVIPFALTNRASVPPENVQHWVSVLLAVYGAALLAASPLCGYLADKTPNRRLPLLFGLLALAGATLLLCLGTSLALLVLGRILQGVSAGVVWTVGLALLADTVGHDTIGQAVGYVSISMSVAILVGPLLGGVVYAKAGYFSVYFMAFGMIILDIILRLFLIEKKTAKQWENASDVEMHDTALPKRNDKAATTVNEPPPLTTSPPAAFSSIPSQQISTTHPSGTTTVMNRKKPLPAVLTLLTSRRLLAALFCTLAQSTLMTAWDAVLPLYTHRLFSFSSLGAGLIFLPLIIPSFMAPLVGYWADKKGPRVPATLGFVFAVPFLVLLRFVDHSGTKQIVLLCALLALIGIAVTNAMTPLLAEITYIVTSKEASHPGAFGGKGAYATAYGLFNTAFAGGMLVGPIWAGFVINSAGWATMCWSLAVLSCGGGVVSGLFVGGWIGRTGSRGIEDVEAGAEGECAAQKRDEGEGDGKVDGDLMNEGQKQQKVVAKDDITIEKG